MRRTISKRPIELVERFGHWMPGYYLFEEIESRVAVMIIWEIRDCSFTAGKV